MNINERAIWGAAKYIKDESYERDHFDYATVRGIPVEIPYQGVVAGLGFGGMMPQLPDEVIECYESMQQLFSEGGFPDNWVPFLEEAKHLRDIRGCESPVDMIHSAFFTIGMNRRYCTHHLGISQFDHLDSGELDLRDAEEVKGRIDSILRDSKMRNYMLNIAANLVPQKSCRFVDRDPVVQIIKKLGMVDCVFLDLGCGVGLGTKDWGDKVNNMMVLGMDRQKFDPWYECWFDPFVKACFVVGDFIEGIPFASEDVSVVLMEHVVHHLTIGAIKLALEEILRVMKPDGLLVVGPQKEDWESGRKYNDGEWRFFRKVVNSRGEWGFCRVRLAEILDG